MKIKELIDKINEGAVVGADTCDGIKAGSESNEIKKAGVSMFATVDVIKQAAADGVNFLIVHEPVYYDALGNFDPTPVTTAKRALIEEKGITVYRYHDHAHFRDADLITHSECMLLGIKGNIRKTEYLASYLIDADEPISGDDLIKRAKEQAGIKWARLSGSRNKPCKKIALCFGTPAGVFELLKMPDVDMVITGEICEWALGEYARDADALDFTKSLAVLGHIGSERHAMKRLAEIIKNDYPDLPVKYYECGEVYI